MTEEKEAYTVVPFRPQSVIPTMPAMTVQEAIERRKQMVSFVKEIMEEGRDFGTIPGTGDKPTLFKPGAEKLSTFFGLSKRFQIIEKVEDWTGKDHGEPFFYYLYRCQLLHGDLLMAEGDGSCNSMEKKYRYRQADRRCPSCGQATIIKGREEYGGGWVCYSRKGGCGMKFKDGDQSIEGQQTGQIINPDIADQVNTIQKMAAKRALVAATLLAVNASEFFTQDLEDTVEGEVVEPPKTGTKQKTTRPTRNGNKDRWQTFLKEHGLSEKEALSALGAESVTEWMKANPGKTETDAYAEILSVSGKA